MYANATVPCWIVTRGSYADETNVAVFMDEDVARKFARKYNEANGYGENHCDRYSVQDSALYINGWKASLDTELVAQRAEHEMRTANYYDY